MKYYFKSIQFLRVVFSYPPDSFYYRLHFHPVVCCVFFSSRDFRGFFSVMYYRRPSSGSRISQAASVRVDFYFVLGCHFLQRVRKFSYVPFSISSLLKASGSYLKTGVKTMFFGVATLFKNGETRYYSVNHVVFALI